jgi:hypothetical protein
MIKSKPNGTEIFCSSFEDTNNLKNGTRIIFKCCVCGEDVVKIFRRDRIENIKLWRCCKHIGCKKYCFVVDKTEKYKNNIVDEITNKSHFGNSKEFIILINGENNE